MSVILKITMVRIQIFRVACLLLLLHAYAATSFMYAKGPSDSSEVSFVSFSKKKTSPSPFVSKIMNQLNGRSLLDSNFKKLPSGFSFNDIKVSGTVRFITIVRDMQKSYSDMITSPKNISFTDYPIVGVGTNNNGGFPVVELNLANNPMSKFLFNVGYSMGNTFTGQTYDTTHAKTISSRQNLRFSGKWNSGPIRVGIDAGGLIWTKLSRLTMGQAQYRDNYSDRVPWDWYRNSFLKYEEYYSLSTNIGAQSAGNSSLYGYQLNTEILPLGVNVRALYGRTNLNTTVANSLNSSPSATMGGRIEKIIFTRKVSGKIGGNFYRKAANTDRYSGIQDNQTLFSVDGEVRVKKIDFSGEVGRGTIANPLQPGGSATTAGHSSGMAFVGRAELSRAVTAFPISLEYYHINNNYVSLDGSVMNSNTTVNSGGYGNSYIYDPYLLVNVSQQVGQLANNRQGFSLKTEGSVKKLKYQLGLSGSQELQNLHDTITFQHRVNSFSASRFRPWYEAGGPYQRIKSVWLTTFETMTITDTLKNYKKGFSNLELLLKYKFKLFNRDFVVMNFNTFNSVQKNFNAIPVFTNKAFMRLFFEDLTGAYKLGKKYNLIGNFGYEMVKGNNQTQLSPVNGKPINQRGFAFGGGIDYDFLPNAGIHFRLKYMTHKDKNFTLDQYRGFESTVELKIFF
ncbi:MAG TPA: hypothetical protein VK766_10100 [Cytophagaceae bacterium]|jgi:hypothetical protein|nr:hypothetical protein [Cytophagaceae bacterium]